MKHLVTLILALGLVCSAVARETLPVSNDQMAKRWAAALAKDLSLSEEVTARIDSLYHRSFDDRMAIGADTEITPQQKRTEAAKISKQLEADIEALLTPEQVEAYRIRKAENDYRREMKRYGGE